MLSINAGEADSHIFNTASPALLDTRSLTVWLCTSKKCSAGLLTGCSAGFPARARTPHSTISSGQRPSGVRHTDGRLCFERARLQSCHKWRKTSRALAPEGSLFCEFRPSAGIGKELYLRRPTLELSFAEYCCPLAHNCILRTSTEAAHGVEPQTFKNLHSNCQGSARSVPLHSPPTPLPGGIRATVYFSTVKFATLDLFALSPV